MTFSDPPMPPRTRPRIRVAVALPGEPEPLVEVFDHPFGVDPWHAAAEHAARFGHTLAPGEVATSETYLFN